MSTDVRVASTEWMYELHRKTLRKPLNRRLSNQALHQLDPEGKHILQVWMLHEHANGQLVKPHYRCCAWLKVRGKEDPMRTFIDVPMDMLDVLPTGEQVKAGLELVESYNAQKHPEVMGR